MSIEEDEFIYVGMRQDKIEQILETATPDQNNPSGFYVYGHYDNNGSLFYVGKGTGKRAWSSDRHPIWHRHVKNHLGGEYLVRILIDGLTSEEADEFEEGLIAIYGETLVNWNNFGRKTDYALLEQYHELRNANRKFIKDTKLLESVDIEQAIQNYKTAIEKTAEYAFLNFETGLVGQLLREENDEVGRSGELEALDRLTMCLIKIGGNIDTEECVNSYFDCYKRDSTLKLSDKIRKRINRAVRSSGVK